jgi:hypothetical protein
MDFKMLNMILKIESQTSQIDNINLFNFQFTNDEEYPVSLFVELNCFLNFDLLDNLIDFLNDDYSSSYDLTLKSYELNKERIFKVSNASIIEFLLSNEIGDIVELNMKFLYETVSMTQNIKNKLYKKLFWTEKKIDHIKNGF